MITTWIPCLVAEDSQLWSTIEPQIKTRLPLQNLFWQDPIAYGSPSKATAVAAAMNASSSNPMTGITSPNSLSGPQSSSSSSLPSPPFTIMSGNSTTAIGSSAGTTSSGVQAGPVGAGIPIRTIPAIDVDFLKFSPDMFPKYVPGGAQQNPFFLHIFFVGCEDNEMYKNNVRKLVNDWVQVVSLKKNHEWMIVHVIDANPQATKKATSGLFTTTTGTMKVFEKLKHEFNVKKERLLQLKLSNNDALDAASWSDLINRIKECVISSGIQQILQLQEDSRRLDQQRLMPGWNYCQYFLMKESLALVYELLTLYDESLLVYDELEATFFQTMREQGVPWIKRFGGTDSGDDSQDILDFRRKPYRDMISQNAITIFDFRIYLFARQCHILGKSGNPLELCQRGKMFISAFSRTLKDYKVSLLDCFGESWTYSACLHLIKSCEGLMQKTILPQATLLTLQGVRGELLHTARVQLDRLGSASSLLIDPINGSRTPPSSEIALSSPCESEEAPAKEQLTNMDLVKALSSVESFDSVYKNLTLQTIDSFQNCNRNRVIIALQSDLAYLHFIRGKYKDAAEIWKRLCHTYKHEGWKFIETVIIDKLAICYEKLNMSDEYFHCLLHLMAFGKLLNPPQNLVPLAEKVIKTIQNIENTIIKEDDPMFSIELTQSHNPVCDDGEIFMDLKVKSRFPLPLDISAVRVVSTGADLKELVCSAFGIQLVSGENIVKLKGKRPRIPGVYTPATCTIDQGNVRFSYDINATGRKRLIRIVEADSSIQMYVKQHETDDMEEKTTRLDFTILSNANSWRDGTLSITSLTGIGIILPESYTGKLVKDGQEEEFVSHLLKSNLSLPEATEKTTICFSLKYDPDSVEPHRQTEHRLKLTLKGNGRDEIPFIYSSIVKIPLSRPLQIIYEPMILPNMSLAMFEITNVDNQPCRLLAQEMICGRGLTLQMYASNDVFLFPEQRTTSVFDISNLLQSDEGEELEFCLKVWYLPLSEEILAFFDYHLQALRKERECEKYSSFTNMFLRRHILPKFPLVEFATFGDISNIELDVSMLNEMLRKEALETRDILTDLFHTLIEKTKSSSLADIRSQISSLVKPTLYQYKGRIERGHILIHCMLEPTVTAGNTSNQPTNFKPMVFESFPCDVVIQCMSWILPELSHIKQVELDYEVELAANEFELSGKRAGKFIIKANETVRIPIFLCPLKPGNTFLPSVKLELRHNMDPLLASRVVTQCLTRLTSITVYPRHASEKIFLDDSAPNTALTTTAG